MVFSIPTFTTVGDDYDKKKVIDERSHGKNFVAVGPKQGTGPDALFSKEFLSIHEGDKFVDPGVADKRYRMEKAKRNLTSNGFRYSNPSPKPSGKGDYFGSFQLTPWPHETDYIVPRKGEAPPRPKMNLRPIYTNPPKKGTYGFPGTTISNVGQDYIACFSIEKPKPKFPADRGPFVISGRLGATFDEGHGTGASQCYKLTKPMPPRKKKEVVEKKKASEAPWRPSGPVPKSAVFVEYREDPYDGFDPREGTKKKHHEDKASWRPGGTTNTSWYTSSIAFKKL